MRLTGALMEPIVVRLRYCGFGMDDENTPTGGAREEMGDMEATGEVGVDIDEEDDDEAEDDDEEEEEMDKI